MFQGLRKRKRADAAPYPRQFWLLLGGVFLTSGSSSMLWPFLTVYIYERLGLPLTTITLLFTIRAVTSILSTSIVGPMMDQIGRKRLMIASLIASALLFVGMTFSSTLPAWVIALAVQGLVLPVFNIGVNAMVADLIPSDQRTGAYSLSRTASNAGIAIGPVIGGTLAIISFEMVFYATSIAFLILSVLVGFFLVETNPRATARNLGILLSDEGGYRRVLADTPFVLFIGMQVLLVMASSHLFSLLPVYVSQNYRLNENEYSILLTINAVMVVFLQYSVTWFSRKFRPFSVIATGALLYAFGLFSISFGSMLPHFAISMAIATLGELLVAPTSTALVADHAPVNMRARYMGMLNIIYPVSTGIGPVIGGILNDQVAPVAIWYGAGLMALAAAAGFLIMGRSRNAVAMSSPHPMPQDGVSI